ncbi:MFS general substrate transporter [Linderina pennispora]|uniref:MFS general substrate transporter n=1 Tax=Linderina pennispora TaxID=61395 RepID=A0A1Y1WLN0_9FUNG|nr:MFS general substrate transporter [Linderina pennispora]ORX74479.1 MFS general substrate transporter [Linderina pennispora]
MLEHNYGGPTAVQSFAIMSDALKMAPGQDKHTDGGKLVLACSSSPSLSSAHPEKLAIKYLPYSPFSNRRKMTIVLVIAVSALISPLAANTYYPAIHETQRELHTSKGGIDATIQAVFPLLWSVFSDNFGRRFVYLGSLMVFIAGSAGCAGLKNLAGMIVCRIIQACGASAVQGSGAGTIADIYERERRGTALGLYCLGPLFGTSLAPLIGGFCAEKLGFRWIFWILAIFGETHRRAMSEKYDTQPINIPVKRSLIGKRSNPLRAIKLLKLPNVSIVCFQIAMSFGILYGLASINATAIEDIYNLSPGQTGLGYIGMGGGNIIGAFVGGRVTDLQIRREQRQIKPATVETGGITSPQSPGRSPEIRIASSWVGGLVLLAGTLMNGWFIQKRVHLAGVIIAQFMIGVGTSFQFNQMCSYFVDLFPTSAASITSVQNLVRNSWTGACIELLPTMTTSINWGPTFTIFAGLALVGSVLVEIAAIKGEYIRQRFHFSPKL